MPDFSWLKSAIPVSGDFDALERASGDAPYILDSQDLDEAVAWVVAEVPVHDIVVRDCRESEYERRCRLDAIRQVDPMMLFRPILHCLLDGSLRLLDGGHRIVVARERGLSSVSCLVRLDFAPADVCIDRDSLMQYVCRETN